jgi:hypothetical protein
VFVELFKKTLEVKRQAAELASINSELRQSEEKFRALSACSPIAIFLTDIEGNLLIQIPIAKHFITSNLMKVGRKVGQNAFIQKIAIASLPIGRVLFVADRHTQMNFVFATRIMLCVGFMSAHR